MMRGFSEIGFLGTQAFFYMDVVLLYMVALPFLMMFSIWLIIKEYYFLHKLSQFLLFFMTLAVVIVFYYELYLSSVLSELLNEAKAWNKEFCLLLFHFIISIITIVLWKSTILFASADRRRRALPGLYSRSHKSSGKRIAFGVLCISITTIILYRMFYVL